jgi:hypothetical protein
MYENPIASFPKTSFLCDDTAPQNPAVSQLAPPNFSALSGAVFSVLCGLRLDSLPARKPYTAKLTQYPKSPQHLPADLLHFVERRVPWKDVSF